MDEWKEGVFSWKREAASRASRFLGEKIQRQPKTPGDRRPPPTPGQTEPLLAGLAAEKPAAPRDSSKHRLHIVPGAGKGEEDQR